jgi:hypothetical protein
MVGWVITDNLRSAGGVLHPQDLPAARVSCGRDRGALRVEAVAVVGLHDGGHAEVADDLAARDDLSSTQKK